MNNIPLNRRRTAQIVMLASLIMLADSHVSSLAAYASPLKAGEAWPPLITFRWRIGTNGSWCNCESGCVPSGGVCVEEQHLQVDSKGSVWNLGDCNLAPPDLGQLQVNEHEVRFSGPEFSLTVHNHCTQDCCAACSLGCFTNRPNLYLERVLSFASPVWPRFFDSQIDDAGQAGEPRSAFRIQYSAFGGFEPFRFTMSRADFDADGHIGGADLALLVGAWGTAGYWDRLDLNGSGVVDGGDLSILLAAWGPAQ